MSSRSGEASANCYRAYSTLLLLYFINYLYVMCRHVVGNLARPLAFLSEFGVSSYRESNGADRQIVEARKERVKTFSTILRTNAFCTPYTCHRSHSLPSLLFFYLFPPLCLQFPCFLSLPYPHSLFLSFPCPTPPPK